MNFFIINKLKIFPILLGKREKKIEILISKKKLK
jgi:hypothetical protein